MGILDNVERGLERAVNGAFARTFRSGVQPVEIASALKRELDIGAVIVDRDRVLAPNRFVARVSPKDAARLQAMGETLERELRAVVVKHASAQQYQLMGEPDVEVRADESITTGVLTVDATQVEGAVDWVAVIEVDGVRHELSRGTTTVGRGSDCGIRITDNAASRKHLELIWDGKAGLARDLGSTNGSKIDGQRFREASLAPGVVIAIGQTTLAFHLAPGRKRSAAATTQLRQDAPTTAYRAASPAPAAPAARNNPAHQNPAAQSTSATSTPPAAENIDQDFWRGL